MLSRYVYKRSTVVVYERKKLAMEIFISSFVFLFYGSFEINLE